MSVPNPIPTLHSAEDVLDAILTDYAITRGLHYFDYHEVYGEPGVMIATDRQRFMLRYHCRVRGMNGV